MVRLLAGHLPGANLFLDDGVIDGELLQLCFAEPVTSAVPYIDEPCPGGNCCLAAVIRFEGEAHQRGSHAAQCRRLARLTMDQPVGVFNTVVHGNFGRYTGLRHLDQMRDKGVCRKPTGDLSAGSAAHSVTNHEDSV